MATLDGHSDWLNDVTFAPDDSTLATAGEDKLVKIWNVPKPKPKTAQIEKNAATTEKKTAPAVNK